MRIRAAAICLFLFACKSPSQPLCPAGTAADARRTSGIIAILTQAGEPAPDPSPRVCYGPASGNTVTSQGVMLLDPSSDDRDLAARMAHLLLHRRDGDPLDLHEVRVDCRAQMQRARTAEERARALEDRVRQRLGRPALDRGELDRVMEEYARRCEP